jgi:hypothetical protein
VVRNGVAVMAWFDYITTDVSGDKRPQYRARAIQRSLLRWVPTPPSWGNGRASSPVRAERDRGETVRWTWEKIGSWIRSVVG